MSFDFAKNPYTVARNTTATPLQQVSILLYRAASYIEKSKEFAKEGYVYERFQAIDKAMSIIAGLSESLNFEETQSMEAKFVVNEMFSFYTKTLRSLMELNASGNLELADRIIDDIHDLAQIWSERS